MSGKHAKAFTAAGALILTVFSVLAAAAILATGSADWSGPACGLGLAALALWKMAE